MNNHPIRKTTAALAAGAALAVFGLGAGGGLSSAQAEELTVMGLEVHLNNMRARGFAEGGIDNLESFESDTGSAVEYITGTVTSLQEALQRLGTLNETEEDVIYVNQLDANERLTSFLQPVTNVLPEGAVDGFPEQWSPGVLASATFDGELYLLPVRCGTFTLWYNERIFADRGFDGPPTTPEELYEIAKASTFTRDNGEQVFGFSPRGDKWSLTEDMTVLARMYGGDLIAPDFEVVINQPPAVAAVELMQQMYREGIIPPNWASIGGSELAELFRNERAAIVLGGANYDSQYNQRGDSRVAGAAVPAHLPLVADLHTDDVDYSPSTIWYWGLGIFNGSSQAELAGDFIRHVAGSDVQMELANNGNAPCTTGVLGEMAKTDPGLAIAEEIFAISRPTIPAHPNMNQVRDMMGETIQNIVINDLDAQSELDRLASRIERLLN